jgi:hypothetical protein
MVHCEVITSVLCSPIISVPIDNRMPIKTTNMHCYFVTITVSPPKLVIRKENLPITSAIAGAIVIVFLEHYRIGSVGKTQTHVKVWMLDTVVTAI